MSDLAARLALKARLPRTWPAFFERHGNFTPAQLAAIPALLDGQNVLLCAPTAGGKTEAALVPLIERHCPPIRTRRAPRILYLTPTRALASDLAARLAHPLETLGLELGIKTGDYRSFRANRPPDLLISTPESLDSALAANAKTFAGLRAIVLDELHLFEGTPRGDQLRVLLNRLRRVRSYAFERGDEPDAELQYAALSATIDPTAGGRYFDDATVLQTRGGRAIDAEVLKLAPDSAELAAYLAAFRERSWRKALAFCNSRAEVEAHAAAIRERSPFGDAVYVHYSNIEAHRRREIERQFAEAGAAICFASSTLELGIDIGDIDVVLLLGPPGSRASFLQRIGRGNRRGGTMHVACFWHTPLERLMFEALLGDDQSSAKDKSLHDILASPASFRPAVAIQQIFSLLKQSPVAAVRLVELAQLFEGMLSSDDVLAILGELQQRDYLRAGRPGEWGAGQRLNKLFDQQASAQPEISIYSNIQGGQRQIEIRDQYTQRTVARVDVAWLGRETLTLEGRALSVEWCDGEAVWVTAQQRRELPDRPIYRSARQLLSYELAAHLPAHLGLPPGATPVVRAGVGWYWFHWLGDLYGRAVLDLLRYTLPAEETTQPGLCLRLAEQPQAMPIWSAAQVTRYLEDHFRQFEAQLDLGPFQTLLPLRLRRRAVVEQFGIERFLDVLAAQQLLVAPETLSEDLAALLLSEGDNATE